MSEKICEFTCEIKDQTKDAYLLNDGDKDV